jgi:excisionase family DNA binding protein
MAAPQRIDDRTRRVTPVSAPPEQRAAVQAFSKLLEQSHRGKRLSKCKLVGPNGEMVVPESVFVLLERAAEVLARGDAVTLVPIGKAVTTQQAADLLNVSRQYLVRLLEDGKLPYTKTGKHRRLRVEDVLAYRAQRDKERAAKLRELTEMSEELGGYSELR